MEILEKISLFVLPCVVFLAAIIVLFGRRENYFACFLEGAKGGIKSCVSLLPSLCALIISVNMLTHSGLCDFLTDALFPLLNFVGLPSEIFPLVLVRPFTGSGALAAFEEILKKSGPDSLVGICASLVMASSDTFVYVICIYFSTTKIKKTRFTLPVCILVSLICLILSSLFSKVILNIC